MNKGMRILGEMTMTPFIIYDYTIHGTQSSHHLKGQFKQFARRINVGGPRP